MRGYRQNVTALVLGVFAWVLAAGSAGGQPLADRVPADAIVYFGWAGSSQLPGYEGSHLKAVVEASDLPQLMGEFIPALSARLMQQGKAQDAAGFNLLHSITGPMWRHPTAVYVTGIDLNARPEPQLNMAVICAAGEESDALLKQLQTALQQSPPKRGMKVEARRDGDLVVLAIGSPTPATGGAALAGAAGFKDSVAALGPAKTPVAGAVYADVEAILKLIDQGVAKGRDMEAKQKWPRVKGALGLDGFKRFLSTGGFDGAGWVTRTFIAAPEPRTGLPAVLAQPGGVSDETLRLVPQTATMASAFRFDAGKFLDEARTAIGKIDANAQKQFNQAVGAASLTIGANVETDLLDALGPEWAVYVDENVGGNGVLGLAVVNRLKNAESAERSLAAAEIAINNILAGQLKKSEATVAFRSTERNGLTIHYLALPLVAPAWAVQDGVLYAGLYPQVVGSAAAYTKAGGKSILDNPQFVEARKGVAAAAPAGTQSAVSYADLPRTAATAYPTWLMLSRLVGFADLFGVQTPPMLLPPISAVRGHLTPAASATWWDAAGGHTVHRSPFPMSDALAGDPSQMSAATTPLLLSVLLPSLNRARETANRVKCASNLRQIGQGMLLYSNEHKGQLPPDLGTVIATQEIGVDAFVCPSGGTAPPPNVREMSPEELGAWVNMHSDYVYLAKGKRNSAPSDEIMVYEKPDDHDRDGINALFGDGHVEFMMMPQAQARIQKQTGRDILAPAVPAPAAAPAP